MKPTVYKYWHRAAQDAYDEREAIMRDGNNIPQDAPTPAWIRIIAMKEAAQVHQEATEPKK